ncbi:unnamed protein product, partial [Prorocentrum cordatum]
GGWGGTRVVRGRCVGIRNACGATPDLRSPLGLAAGPQRRAVLFFVCSPPAAATRGPSVPGLVSALAAAPERRGGCSKKGARGKALALCRPAGQAMASRAAGREAQADAARRRGGREEEERRRWDGGSGAAVRPHGPEQRPEAPLPVQRERQAAKALERTQARCGDLSLPPSLSPPIGSLAVLPPTRPVVAEHGWAGVKNGPWGLTCCPCQSRRSGSRCPCRGARPGGRSRRSAHWTRRSASASALSQSSPPPGHGTWPCCPHSCRRGCAITTSPAPQRPAPLRTDPTRRGSD